MMWGVRGLHILLFNYIVSHINKNHSLVPEQMRSTVLY